MLTVDQVRVRRSWGHVARKKTPLRGNGILEQAVGSCSPQESGTESGTGFLGEDKISIRKTQQPSPSLTERIAQLEAELQSLKVQQRQELVAVIASVVPPGYCFSARDLWQRQVLSAELKSALFNAGIQSPRQLGKRLRTLGLERVGVDELGAQWVCR